MSTIAFDGQSFLVDGRRLWLVSGTIHYAGVPRKLWASRIAAARQAGLNCIDTHVVWAHHEREPGRFDFDGERDLRAFVEMVGEAGMWCVLRPGPAIGGGWDFGGLPPWLARSAEASGSEARVKLRQSDPRFLEASARYLGAVMGQVRDLQVTTPTPGPASAAGPGNAPGRPAGGFTGGGRGPIVLMQAEHQWWCHNEEQAEKYLREVVRYLMENGCEVPILSANNLWQRVDGTIDTWSASRNLLADLRQLSLIQPEAPRLVSDLPTGEADAWDRTHAEGASATLHLYRIAQVLAAGGQFNLAPFHGGTHFGFSGGRLTPRGDAFATTSHDGDAPLLEAGGRGPRYDVTKRISTFASQFAQVLAHLTESPHASVAIDEEARHPIGLVHQSGTQGEVVFLFKSAADRSKQANVLLPNGLTLPVPLEANERAAWLLLNTQLGGVAQLEYTNLRPWAFLGRKLLVLYGPAGGDGIVNIDDVPMQIKVPTGREPRVEPHESLSVVVLNTEQVDATYIDAQGLVIGAGAVDEHGAPSRRAGWSRQYRVTLDGAVTREQPPGAARATAPRLARWRHAPLDAILDGSDAGFEKIAGPRSLESLQCGFGYGWYRISMGKGQSGRMLAPLSGDRLHVYGEGKLQALLGVAPGATDAPVQMRLAGEIVVLADNLGRPAAHAYEPQPKGLVDHIHVVRQARLAKPGGESVPPADPFELSGYVPLARRGAEQLGATEALLWHVKPTGRKPMIFELGELPLPGVVSVNGHPVSLHHPAVLGGPTRLVLTPGEGGFTGGRNELRLTPLAGVDKPGDLGKQIEKHVHLLQSTGPVTGRAQWSFCPWRVPADDAFNAMPGSSKSLPSQPAWFRAEFTVSDASVPLWLEPRGMSKGQIFLNGHNVGRYFVATRQGKAVGPQKHYYLPEPWLRTDAPNELLLFDEHGRDPRQCRLTHNRMGPYHSEPRAR